MAINTRKISGLPELSSINGSEYLMVANEGKSYKIKTSLLTSDIIRSIEQTVVEGDGEESPIVIKTSNGDVYNFSVRNGNTGKPGPQGKKGEKGESGNSAVTMYNIDPSDLIIDTLDDTTHSESDLSQMILSARQGSILNDKLDKLKEVYCTQEQYDQLLNDGQIDITTKYFIVEE